jgi:hypothetical protein
LETGERQELWVKKLPGAYLGMRRSAEAKPSCNQRIIVKIFANFVA